MAWWSWLYPCHCPIESPLTSPCRGSAQQRSVDNADDVREERRSDLAVGASRGGGSPHRQALAAKAPAEVLRLPDEPPAPKRLPVLDGGYLFPILAYGPNNQVAGLKEALVMGRLLNRTVVVQDIRNIYHDAKKGGVNGRMDFKLVFDFDLLSRYHSIVTLEELRAEGWDGHLGAIGHFGRAIWSWIKVARYELNATDESAKYIEFGKFDCSAPFLQRMAKELLPYKVVGVPLANKVLSNAMYGVALKWNGARCHDMYLQASGHLVKSKRVGSIAHSFREKRLGGADAPYVAVHVRPYTDLCLQWWHKDTYDKDKAAGHCKNGHLYLVFVNETVQHMRRLEETVGRGKAKLFVMSYPELKRVITKMYREAGLRPIFYEQKDLEAELGRKTSISMLGMVEQEIAYQANIFIGSAPSSMTGMVQQERFARGIPMENTVVFSTKK
ncbi:hypothetical protein HYH03_012052 [Edaphochlamys debaryana]|uniref:GDP-fucose protein O-fucosyltransferase 2 n=1 Tax=Edaphochlamys debaryana TaxID=47281 RepID=A0A835XUT5_9CHLO|nr:hypothetical protein HYH03_012052 [Edaphochlamys debaryana]|eukprot:KAG2489413.1 hypothetical protein HYH03_012052 [Edaphochlamys debaryana]